MKTSAIIVAASAALAHAQHGLPDGTQYNCAKPNANYCLGGDIILRCDENALGTPGRCSDNLAGYAPAGGVASCWESAREAGDAACQKNCIVHAEPSFTLGTDECEPTYTATTSDVASSTDVSSTIGTGSVTSSVTDSPTDSLTYTSTYTPSQPVTWPSNSTSTTYTNKPSQTGGVSSTLTTITYTHTPPYGNNGTASHPTGSQTSGHTGPTFISAPGNNSTTTRTSSRVPVPPTRTSEPVPLPTGGAATNSLNGLLVAVVAAAYFL